MSLLNRIFKRINGGCSAVIVAGGASSRMKGVDKIFADLGGMPVIARTLRAFEDCELVDEIVLVIREDKIEQAKKLGADYGITKLTGVVAGGATRVESVRNGLRAANADSELIAIHDGARPLVTDSVIREAINAATEYNAACPAIEMKSTVKTIKKGFVDTTPVRDTLREIQTPQVFKAHVIRPAITRALETKAAITDDCGAVEALGVPVYLTHGAEENIKITTQTDLVIAEALIGIKEAAK